MPLKALRILDLLDEDVPCIADLLLSIVPRTPRLRDLVVLISLQLLIEIINQLLQ